MMEIKNGMNRNWNQKKPLMMLLAIAMLATTILGGVVTSAFLSHSTDPLSNFFSKGIKYTLSYHANAGDENVEVPEDQSNYGEGKFTISSDKPVRDDFVFIKWNTKDDGTGQDVLPASEYTTDQRHTDLYAIWESGYTLIYDANGGSNPPETDTFATSDSTHTFTIRGQESMTGKNEYKVFLGWSEDKNATVPTYGPDGKYAYQGPNFDGDNTVALEGDIELPFTERTKTLYAVWATHYKLIFDANEALNGTGNVPATQEKISTKTSWTFDIPENPDNNDPAITPKRSDASKGYYFGWWAQEPDNYNENQGYQYGEPVIVYESPKMSEHQDPWKILYAVYKPPTSINLYYNANGGSGAPGTYWGSVLADTQDVTISEIIPTRTNYVFLGWSKDKNATEFNPDGKKDFNPGDIISINIYEDAKPTLYAVWRSKHYYRLQFNKNSGTRIYYKNASGNWTYTTSSYINHDTPWLNDENHIVTEYTFTVEELMNKGVFATRDRDDIGDYIFRGWSYKENPTLNDIDIPVTAPADPSAPTGSEGLITQPIVTSEPDANCNTPRGHTTVLYAVWERVPLHTYVLIFTKNVDATGKLDSTETIRNRVNNGTLSTTESGEITSVMKDSTGGTIMAKNPSGNIYKSETAPASETPSKVWEQSFWQTDNPVVPTATKTDTATERYEFIGWSYEPYSDHVDIPVDENGRITSPIQITEPHASADECIGEKHYLLLFPVFKTIPQHTFNLYFAPNYTSLGGFTKKLEFQYVNNGYWYNLGTSSGLKITDIHGVLHDGDNDRGIVAAKVSSKNQEVTVESWPDTANEKYWIYGTSDRVTEAGVRASCVKTTSGAGQSFKFLGWSYNRNNKLLTELDASDVDIPVDENGKLLSDVVIKESDVTALNNHCNDDVGYEHNVVLYGVWESEPMHQYSIVFSGNLDGSKVMAKNSSGRFVAQSTTTISELTDFNGNEHLDIKQAWNCNSPAIIIAEDTQAEYTWTPDMWKNIGVYAEKEKDAKFMYTFLGWSHDKNASSAEITVDEVDKYIQQSVTVKDLDIANCESESVHYDVLYGVWKVEPIPATHTFQVKFNLNGGSYYKYFDGTNWRTSSSSSYSTYNNPEGEIRVDENPTYTFTADYWKNTAKGLSATRNNSNTHSFNFVGWANSTNPEDPNYRIYNLDAEGFIGEDIVVECDKPTECEDGKHILNLYAVWKEAPLTKSYTLKFDYNLPADEIAYASGLPADIVQYETYDNGWVNKSTFDIPTQAPTYRSFAFVGWSTNKNDIPGVYGVPSDANPELHKTTEGLLPQYVMSASNNYNSNPTTVTLYAIWAYEYQMTYDANDGAHAPSMEHEYTNQSEHIYGISPYYPLQDGYEFLGWSFDPMATEPEFSCPEKDTGYPTSISVTADPSGSTKLRLYAVWKENE